MRSRGKMGEMRACGSQDDVLKWLLAKVEEKEGAVPIILNVQGAVISGEIISEQEYRQILTQSLAAFGDKDSSPDTLRPGAGGYIHLKNAKIFFSSIDTAPLEEGVLWRGKLSSIDGFILGAFRSYP